MNQTQLEFLWEQFDEWWAIYPLKIGRLAARKAYVKARDQATVDQLLEGVAVYKRTKPDWQDWCHPVTFLNQGRWLDERPAPQRKVAGSLQKWWD